MSQVSAQPIAAKAAGSSRKTMLIAAAVVVLAVGSIAAWKMRPVKMPSLSSDPVTIAKFVSSPDFERLKESQRQPYRIALRAKTKELAAGLQSGQLTREQYEEAYLNGWLARQMDHMGDFYRLPVAKEPQPPHEVEKAFIQRVTRNWDEDEQAKWDQFRQATKNAKKSASEK
jgi:hypothetical protein